MHIQAAQSVKSVKSAEKLKTTSELIDSARAMI
jgi:hypothetical protein